ncbi:hypothetical protein IOD16_37580 [Saccharothrix sp. 6-C]|uniref:hypothetical protein n=1 Tax=Saccharothrix sp. 6-C TaxID=2781735 RepID=UPI0019170557|nr:hypothetical protein [Saccharothrix sp. 6-C]QQQ76628.1 hypothetical protein IOD16_37580 [Saccharothrix sp. 6-C]
MRRRREPRDWPSLLHRIASDWRAQVRLLTFLLALLLALAITLRGLGEVTVHIGPFGVEHRPLPVLTAASAP